jgi:hypothetical protein
MKRLLIASIVGSLILYAFLFIAHVVLPVHFTDYKKAPAEDSLLNLLSSTLKEEGMYMLPYFDAGMSNEDMEAQWKERMGKPWIHVNYNASMDENPMLYVMSFLYNFISVLILCIALAVANAGLASFFQRLWFVLLFALFTVFSVVMMQYNWDSFPMHYLGGHIFDAVMGYLLVGIWLAWYYGRLQKSG